MELESFFKKDHVIFLENNEKQLVFRELLKKLENFGKIEKSSRYYTQVIHRESLENTGIGNGLAIPHTRTDSVHGLTTILGISREGIDYQAYDSVPVNYVLLSIFPTEMSTKYLYLIGMIARVFSNVARVNELNEAKTPAKIYSILNKAFQNYFENLVPEDEKCSEFAENLSNIPSSDLDLLIKLDRLYQIYDEGDKSESINNKIDQLKTLIDNRSLTYYKRMREKCKNPFSIVEKNSCAGCHLEVPAMLLKQIQKEKSVTVCNHCGRFLIVL